MTANLELATLLGMTKKIMVVVAAVVIGIVLASLLAACGGTDSHDADIDSGVVVKRTHKRVTVLEDDHEYDTHRLRGKKCQVGSRWPDCKTR